MTLARTKLFFAILAVLALASSALAAYAFVLFDPAEYLDTRPLEVFSELGAERLDELTAGMAGETHSGPGPCLRYLRQGQVPDSDLEDMAERIVDAGLADHVADLAPQFMVWNEERERDRHESSRAEEHLEMLAEAGGISDRVLIALTRYKLLAVSEIKAIRDRMLLMERAVKAGTKLSNEQRDQVKALWERCPACLTLPVLVSLMDKVKGRLTRERLRELAKRVEGWAGERKNLPESLDLLVGPTEQDLLRDGWHRDFEYDQVTGGARILSLGADGANGGESHDTDLEQKVLFNPLSPEAAPNDPCSPPLASITLERALVDETLADMTMVVKQARIIPAFENGKAIGFKLASMAPGSIFSRVGLRNGDVVTSVQGRPLTSPDEALETYTEIRRESKVTLKVKRCGRTYRIAIGVR